MDIVFRQLILQLNTYSFCAYPCGYYCNAPYQLEGINVHITIVVVITSMYHVKV